MAARRAKAAHRRDRSATVALIVLPAAALVVRLVVGLVALSSGADDAAGLGDSAGYRNIADNVVAGRGLVMTDLPVGPSPRYADRMPGYPLVLAALKAAFGETRYSLMIVQSIVGAATVWLTWLLGREVYGPLAGWLAAAGVALGAWQVIVSALALTECWSALLVVATVLCVVRAVRHDRLAWSAAAGLCGGLLVYMHPGFIALPLAFGLVAALAPGRARRLTHWAVGAAVVVAALVPWWIRNAAVFERPVLTTTRLGVSLYDGLRSEATGASDMVFEERLADRTRGLDEAAYDACFRDLAWQAVRRDPGRAVHLAGEKVRRLWSPASHQSGDARLRWWSIVSFVPMVGGALLGLVVMLRRPGPLAALLVPVAYVTMVHLVMVGSIRYRVPVEPLVWVMAAAAVAWVIEGDVRADER